MAAMSTSWPSPLEPGKAAGLRRAYARSEFTLPEKCRPPGSGTSTRSRGNDSSDTVPATGRARPRSSCRSGTVRRPTPASTPSSRTLKRARTGVGDRRRRRGRNRGRRGARHEAGRRRRRRGRLRLPCARRGGTLDEDLVDALAADLGHVARVHLRRGDRTTRIGDRDRVAHAQARQARIGERRAEGEKPPDEEHDLEDDQPREDPVVERDADAGRPRSTPRRDRPTCPASSTSGSPKIAARRMRPAARWPRPGTMAVSRAGTYRPRAMPRAILRRGHRRGSVAHGGSR